MKKSKLDMLLEKSSELSNFNFEVDANDFESTAQSLYQEDVQNMVKIGMPLQQSAQLSMQKIGQLRQVMGLPRVIGSGNTNNNIFPSVPELGLNNTNQFKQNTVATFTIKLKRLTANIAENLNVPIFGKSLIDVFFNGLLRQQGSVSVVGVQYGIVNTDPTNLTATIGNANKLRIRYSDGGAVPVFDIVEVTCNEKPYPSFVNDLGTDAFLASGLNYKVSNPNVGQADNALNVISKTQFGKQVSDTLTPSNFENATDFRDNLVGMGIEISIDKDTFIAHELVATAGIEVTQTWYIQKYLRAGKSQL